MLESPSVGKGQYAVLREAGLVLGSTLSRRASEGISGAKSSPIFASLSKYGQRYQTSLKAWLEDYYQDNDFLVLSNESYFHTPMYAHTLLEAVPEDVSVEFLAWIRPPANLVNSAWWQWGAWSGRSLESYIDYFSRAQMRWSDFASSYADAVDKLHIIPLNDDIIADFCELYSISTDLSDVGRTNVSLPDAVLRLYQRHRDLRPEPQRPRMDFILSRAVTGGKPPWVIPFDEVSKILDFVGKQIPILRNHIPDQFIARLDEDRRWFDSSMYADLVVQDWRPRPAKDDELDSICYEVIKHLDNLYRQLGM
ncbi:hypothetical protein GCM10027591_00040 [Zhihengliuella somnathii]